MNFDWAHTGLDGLDETIQGLRKGDNVVWQINRIEAYRFFVQHFAKRAIDENKRVVYMRFARHEPLLDVNDPGLKVYQLDAGVGFESFASDIHNIITREGKGVYYIFDCLSDLLFSWATDLMIGNFFVVVCPYLYELDTIAYFGIFRDKHSYKTIARIQQTTQLLLDLYQEDDDYYLHPIKVMNRYSPTMFLPHLKEGEGFEPVTSSFATSHLFSNVLNNSEKNNLQRNLDYWDRLFWEAKNLLDGDYVENDSNVLNSSDGLAGETLTYREMFEKIYRLMLTKDERISNLIDKYFDLKDLVQINNRLIGTGFIGGKSLGMLLARNILHRNDSSNYSEYLEEHDSFYIGSDVFYTYIVQNGWWKLRLKQKTEEGYYYLADELRDKLLKGKFPDEIKDQFHNMLDYFGQSPIIVRSSSLLEDGYGNAFAGKYDSYFCVNQGTPEERYNQFEETVRKVYASSMNEDALVYRRERGLSDKDEQMALLVQRVSGKYRNNYFFPDAAGVGVSYNTFAWSNKLNPEAGMLRLVFGLGTRAVNRVEGDYPRIVALDNLCLQSYSNNEDSRKYSQHKIDLLDIPKNSIEILSISSLMGKNIDIPQMKLFGKLDRETVDRMRQLGIEGEEAWIINFESLLLDTDFPVIMKGILKELEEAYQYPVDIEFTVNITEDLDIKVNLVQCRPLQIKAKKKKGVKVGDGVNGSIESGEDDGNNIDNYSKEANKENILFSSKGNFMGGSFIQPIRRIIYVRPEAYSNLPQHKKYDIARLVGKLNRQIYRQIDLPILLIGPGRWGTSTPSLGVPVKFSEINHTTILMEVASNNGVLVPELSFGSHFFQDLVESNIIYIALFPDNKEVTFNEDFLLGKENRLAELVSNNNKYQGVVHVCDIDKGITVFADLVTQKIYGALDS